MTDNTKSNRQFEMSIDIDASPDDVWSALTEAEELVRWFPLQAEVTPGAGGSMRFGWNGAWAGLMRIDKWDAPRLLRLVDEHARPYDADGQPLDAAAAPPATVAITMTLETVDGRTRVRLVHSGFGSGAAWDDELDGVSTGWQMELRNLRHYLTCHRGRDRRIGQVHGSIDGTMADVWSRLVGPGGVTIDAPHPEEGQPYTATLPGGVRLTGRIQLYLPGRDFSGTVAELGDGLFRISTHPAGERAGYMAWVVSYDTEASRIDALEAHLQRLAADLFPSSQLKAAASNV